MTERPNWSALGDMIADLRRATADLPELHRRMLTVTGTAWSPDGMVKAVVGPRGHLLELDIDPRVLRHPNSKALSAGIVQTVRAAVEDAAGRPASCSSGRSPSDMRARQLGGTDLTAFVGSHDADVRVQKGDDDG